MRFFQSLILSGLLLLGLGCNGTNQGPASPSPSGSSPTQTPIPTSTPNPTPIPVVDYYVEVNYPPTAPVTATYRDQNGSYQTTSTPTYVDSNGNPLFHFAVPLTTGQSYYLSANFPSPPPTCGNCYGPDLRINDGSHGTICYTFATFKQAFPLSLNCGGTVP